MQIKPQRHGDTEKPIYYDEGLTSKIIACAIEVHRHLGPGLLESTYEECFCHELNINGISFERQKPLPLEYKGIKLDCGYRMDMVVDNKVVIELKCVDKITSVHEAQLLTYLKLSNIRVGLIINFYTSVLKDGIRRLVL
ncbi:MAG: GxxExxY protein [Nitrospinae bacterium RIFCSPLOWO2_12_FULL_45_22]|nr:MAG: GxxExxY protein [Nitrospinae bacterium RIFCSPLOWO2_12_FULL_45_22]